MRPRTASLIASTFTARLDIAIRGSITIPASGLPIALTMTTSAIARQARCRPRTINRFRML
jgi:hypothetical protein